LYPDDELLFFDTIDSKKTMKLSEQKKMYLKKRSMAMKSIYVEYYYINLHDNMFQFECHFQVKLHLVYNIDLHMFELVVDRQNQPVNILKKEICNQITKD